MTPNLTLHQAIIQINNQPLSPPLNLSIYPGEVWGILSPNGIGKTTLLHTLAGLQPLANGELLLQQTPLQHLPRKVIAKQIAVLFQQSSHTLPLTVWEYCLASRYPHLGHFSQPSAADIEIVKNALNTMSLTHQAKKRLTQLSGGEKRRVEIAAVLAQTPRIYLLDEPTNHLDIRHQHQTLTHFASLAKQQQATVIMTLHDVHLAKQYCEHIFMLYDQHDWQYGKTSNLLTRENASRLYQYPILG